MVFVTGDVHCPIDVSKLNRKNFPEQKKLMKDDFLIVCGDMGIVWNNPKSKAYKEDIYWQKWFSSKSFTTLFVDGNHENFDMLNSYPIEEKWNGRVQKICDNVYHLMRGEIYTICDKTFFCFGGGSSHDKMYRKEGVSWWPDEIPSYQEVNYGIEKLNSKNNCVDFIISHCCSDRNQDKISKYYEKDSLTKYFDFIEDNVKFSHWYFGHYHEDIEIDDKHTCLYQKIVKVL